MLKLRTETAAKCNDRRIKHHSRQSSHIVESHPLYEKHSREEEVPKADQDDTQAHKLRRNRHAQDLETQLSQDQITPPRIWG